MCIIISFLSASWSSIRRPVLMVSNQLIRLLMNRSSNRVGGVISKRVIL